jgi:type III pantothenate kinase
MILEIDVGNTRIKWRSLLGGVCLSRGVVDNEGLIEWLRELDKELVPNKIRLSCVASRNIVACIEKQSDHWGSSFLEAKTSEAVAGVRCGYDDPFSMGVDRWLAVVAAYHRYQQPCVVVDAGSAITVDIVDGGGKHLGGYIVPGFEMMYQSLFHGTSKVKVTSEGQAKLVPGRSTAQAVTQGSLLMVRSMVESIAEDLRAREPLVQVVVTGGDGHHLMAVLDSSVCFDAELVLDGLKFVVP